MADLLQFAARMTIRERAIIEAYARIGKPSEVTLDSAAVRREAFHNAVAVYRKYERRPVSGPPFPHMAFMREVLSATPDLTLRARLRYELRMEWTHGERD